VLGVNSVPTNRNKSLQNVPVNRTVPVTDDVLQQPMNSEDLPEEKLGYMNCVVLCRYGVEVRKIGQSINHYIDTVLTLDLG
jgi:hypothetical protein